MDNSGDERTTINVKGVLVKSWEQAKKAAHKQAQPMGVWLSRAADQLANLEDGPREFPSLAAANPELKSGNLSGPFGNPETMTPEQVAMMMQGFASSMQAMAALSAAGKPVPSGLRRAFRLADDQMRAAQGLPPAPVRVQPVRHGKAAGKTSLVGGKAALIEGEKE